MPSEANARVEIQLGRTAKETEVCVSIRGELELEKVLELQRRLFVKELPRRITDFQACGNCKSGLGRFVIDHIDPRVNPAEVSPLRMAGKIAALRAENTALRAAIKREVPTVEAEVFTIGIG